MGGRVGKVGGGGGWAAESGMDADGVCGIYDMGLVLVGGWTGRGVACGSQG